MSSCSILKAIETTEQALANFLSNPAAFNSTQRANISAMIESIKGAVRELPIKKGPKNDMLNRLTQAQNILKSSGLEPSDRILAVLSILSIVELKVENRRLCCPQGIVTVVPSCKFSTACNVC